MKYKESLVHHEYLNALMDQFDTNKDGNLDRDEIKRMLQIILRDGAKLQLNSKGREYKLSSLENLYNKGILDKNSYMQKLHKAQGGGDDVVKYSEVSDEDVDFILKEADADGNGVLDRDEVLGVSHVDAADEDGGAGGAASGFSRARSWVAGLFSPSCQRSTRVRRAPA